MSRSLFAVLAPLLFGVFQFPDATARPSRLRPGNAPFDLLIRGGQVVDGLGNEAFVSDLGIRDGRIVAIGDLSAKSAAGSIDATGLVVAPGFIDIHNHSDESIVGNGDATSMVRQGVTTMVFGEGGSAAPSKRWKDFTSYFSELRKRGIATNVASYVGSSQIWTHVRGNRAGPPSNEELGRMRDDVRKAMDQGAMGVASSLSGPPGVWIDTNTLVEMCKVAAEFGGIYSTHLRTEGEGVFKAAAEAIEIGKRAGVPVDIIHLKIADHKLWGRMPELLALIEKARSSGQNVQANVYPYRAGQNNLASIIPPWAHEGGVDSMLNRLKDASLRKRLEREIVNGIPGSDWYNHFTAAGSWERMLLVSFRNPKYKRFQGRRMSDVIKALNKPPIDVLLELLIGNEGSVPTVFFHHSEEDMRKALAHPLVSIGSDGTAVSRPRLHEPATHPHPRYYGTFPRVLGKYVRKENLLTLEEAIRKMTSANADRLGISDRGSIEENHWADITIFNPKTVVDKATFENPHQYPIGIEYVIVNGKLTLDKGLATGSRPGKVLLGRRTHPTHGK